jgi:hypothetical protein
MTAAIMARCLMLQQPTVAAAAPRVVLPQHQALQAQAVLQAPPLHPVAAAAAGATLPAVAVVAGLEARQAAVEHHHKQQQRQLQQKRKQTGRRP